MLLFTSNCIIFNSKIIFYFFFLKFDWHFYILNVYLTNKILFTWIAKYVKQHGNSEKEPKEEEQRSFFLSIWIKGGFNVVKCSKSLLVLLYYKILG